MTQPAGQGRDGRVPLPQRQEGQLRGPRDQRPETARRREGLPQDPTRSSSTGRQVNIGNIGYRLVEKNQAQVPRQASRGLDLDLKPRDQPLRPAHHRHHAAPEAPARTCSPRRWTTATPAASSSGWPTRSSSRSSSTSRSITSSPTPSPAQPIPKANVEFFGYRQEWVNEPDHARRTHVVHTADSPSSPTPTARSSSRRRRQRHRDYQWLITATTPEGRLAYLGFTGVWYGNYYDPEYNADKVFGITDRPVYRPEPAGEVQVLGRPRRKYDQEGKSRLRRPDVHRRGPQSRRARRSSRRPSPPTNTAGSTASSRCPRTPRSASTTIYVCSTATSRRRQHFPRRGVQEAGVRGEGRGARPSR